MQSQPPDRRAALPAERLIVVACLLIFYALAVGAAVAKSPTTDEPIHLARGALLRQSGGLDLQGGHTPLSHRLIGLLFSSEPSLPTVKELATWATGDRLEIVGELLWHSGVNVDRLLFLGRLPIIWSGLLLGAVLALWITAIARQQTTAVRPRLAALAIVMGFYAFSSNLIASAALATTDFIATVTYVATVAAWWFYWQRPGWLRWGLTGIMLGLALAAKLTGVLLVPLLLIPLAYVYRHDEPWRRPALVWLGLLPVAGLTLWAVYGFQFGPPPGLALSLPAPAYWKTWQSVLTHVERGHQSFFLGRLSGSGWLLYFPVTFLIKTPLGFLLLLAPALVWLARTRPAWRIAVFTLVPAVFLLAVAAYSRLNIGYRHILPALPFLIIALGAAVPGLWVYRPARWVLAGGLAWVAVATLWQHPHHLAYFNELVGGSGQGYRYLGDSNLDWGQDLKLLAEEAGDDWLISYAGSGDPAYYGLDQPRLAGQGSSDAIDFAPANPAPGRYAISVNHLQGLTPDRDLFDWFRRREPVEKLGYSIFVYDVAAAQPGRWIAHCLAPGPLLKPGVAETLVGKSDEDGLRHVYFDCRQTWVFPENGAPGWYVLPRQQEAWWIDELWPESVETRPHPVYEHHASAQAPEYAVYYWPGGEVTAEMLNFRTDGISESGEPATPLGYRTHGGEWATLWEVKTNAEQPLSLQAHLYAAGATTPAVADGLGYDGNQWRPGDRFIQRHTFPPETPGDYLETGLYDYRTLEPVGPRYRLPAPER